MTITWIAPDVERPGGANVAPERQAIEELLEYHRATLLWKCAGLTGEQLARRAVPPSSMSLLGLVRHMAEVERVWFRDRLDGEDVDRIYGPWDTDFDEADAVHRRDGSEETIDVRALLLHMIEEYARHNGHADLLRECVDGNTGD